jgi:predicted NBD/HSP70 family sugar kinase
MAGCDPDELRAEYVIRAGLEGDELARGVLEETGEYLGIGISNVVNLYNPELVVVGGSTMRAGNMLLSPMIRVVQRRALPGLAERVRIVPGSLREDAGAVGAAALVLRELFALSVPKEEPESSEQGTTVR